MSTPSVTGPDWRSVLNSRSCDQSLLQVLLFNHQTFTRTLTQLGVRTRQRALKTSDSMFFQASLCQTSCFWDFLHMYICVRCREDSVANQRAQAHWGNSLLIVKDSRRHPRHHCSIMPALYVCIKRCFTLASLPPMHMLFDVQNIVFRYVLPVHSFTVWNYFVM